MLEVFDRASDTIRRTDSLAMARDTILAPPVK
jgi:hypothetical protein